MSNFLMPSHRYWEHGKGGSSEFREGGDLSQYMGEHEGGFQIRRKQVVDNCSSDWAEIIKYFPIVSHFFRKFEYSKSELMFLWYNCKLLPTLFYKWNTDINGSFRYLNFFSRNHFLERGFIYQRATRFSVWEGLYFQEGVNHGLPALMRREDSKEKL